MKLKCYVCGNHVTGTFYLATEAEDETDRVFIVEYKCVEQVNKDVKRLLVSDMSTGMHI